MLKPQLVKLYTKSGDRGESGLIDGKRLSKSELVFEVLGGIDEVNSWLGLVIAKAKKIRNAKSIRQAQDKFEIRNKSQIQKSDYQNNNIVSELVRIQNNLLVVGAVVSGSEKVQLEEGEIKFLEKRIDWYQGQLGEEWYKQFLLPGGSELAARIDVARAVCRRVERVYVRWIDQLNRSVITRHPLRDFSQTAYSAVSKIGSFGGQAKNTKFTEKALKQSSRLEIDQLNNRAMEQLDVVGRYLNRLSDYLFSLRCYVNWVLKHKEHKFNPSINSG